MTPIYSIKEPFFGKLKQTMDYPIN